MAQERIAFQGLPARICWRGLGARNLAGLAFNEMVRNGELKAPVVLVVTTLTAVQWLHLTVKPKR